MEYIYGAMLLHAASKDINEENLKKVVEAAGVKSNDAQIKALVASLDGVDIEKAISEAAVVQTAAAPSASGDAGGDMKEEKKKEEKKEEDTGAAAAGLGALFG